MANTAYPLGAQKILTGAINLDTDTIKAALLPSTYTFSTTHEFLSALGARVGTDQTLANTSITGGVFDADDLDYGPIAPGSTVKALVIYKDTGNAATSPVLLYYDVLSGFPFTTNGGGVTIPWGNDIKKIARLAGPFFPLGAQKTLAAAINFSTDTIKAVLLPSSYVYSASHEFLSDLGTVIGTAQTLTGKSVTGGVFDAADVAFGPIAAGSTIGGVAIYKEVGGPTTSPLLMRFTDSIGLPLATNGSAVSHQWSDGSAKIVSLIPA